MKKFKEILEATKWKKGDGRPQGAAHIENVKFWDLPDDSLRYIQKDAHDAMKANPEGKKAGKYADEVNDAATVLFWRKKNRISVNESVDVLDEAKSDTSKYTDDKLKAVLKQLKGLDQDAPSTKSMLKKIEKEMKKRGLNEQKPFSLAPLGNNKAFNYEGPKYQAKAEKSRFSDGWRSVVYDVTNKRDSMSGGVAYKNKADAVGEAQAYIDVLMTKRYAIASDSRSDNLLDKALKDFSKGKVVATPYKKRGMSEDFQQRQDLKDAFYNAEECYQVLSALEASSAADLKSIKIDKKKETAIWKKIVKLADQSELGKYL